MKNLEISFNGGIIQRIKDKKLKTYMGLQTDNVLSLYVQGISSIVFNYNDDYSNPNTSGIIDYMIDKIMSGETSMDNNFIKKFPRNSIKYIIYNIINNPSNKSELDKLITYEIEHYFLRIV